MVHSQHVSLSLRRACTETGHDDGAKMTTKIARFYRRPGRSRASDTEKYKAHSSEGDEISSFITAILRREDEPRKIHTRTGVSNLVEYLRCLYKLRFLQIRPDCGCFRADFSNFGVLNPCRPFPNLLNPRKCSIAKKRFHEDGAVSYPLGTFSFPFNLKG